MIKHKKLYRYLFLIIAFLNYVSSTIAMAESAGHQFFTLTANAEWMLKLSFINGKLEEEEKIYHFENRDEGFSVSMDTRMSIDADENTILGGEVTAGFRVKYVIAKYDISQNSFQILGSGQEPLVNREFQTILFSDSMDDPAQSIPLGIYISKLQGNKLTDKKLLMPYFPAPAKSPLLLGQEGFALYDAATRKTVLISPDGSDIKILDLKEGCIPAIYRSKTQELVCQTANKERRYYLLNLYTNETKKLDWNRMVAPGVYLEDTDSVIYSVLERHKYKIQETVNHYIYSFETGEIRKIKENFWASSKSMVLVPPLEKKGDKPCRKDEKADRDASEKT